MSSLSPDSKDLKTFQEWSDAGYLIKKGEHHVAKSTGGQYLFSRKQVIKKPIPLYWGEPDLDWEDDFGQWDNYGDR